MLSKQRPLIGYNVKKVNLWIRFGWVHVQARSFCYGSNRDLNPTHNTEQGEVNSKSIFIHDTVSNNSESGEKTRDEARTQASRIGRQAGGVTVVSMIWRQVAGDPEV